MRMMMKLPVALLLVLAFAGRTSAQSTSVETQPPNAPTQRPAFEGQTRAPEVKANVDYDVVTIAEGLEYPWGVEFLPGGRFLVTERPGRLRLVSSDGTLSAPVEGLPPIDFNRQGGLFDVVLDPDFETTGHLYLSYAERGEGSANHTALARGRLVESEPPRLDDVRVIYRQVPSLASAFHFGGRIAVGPDGTLYMTQGERGADEYRPQAQDLGSLLGKIIRINRDGTIPPDNPFVGQAGARAEIWSYGHRNSSAIAFRFGTDELWQAEHGTRGGDELNRIRKGANYGWPVAAYGIEYRGGPIGDGDTVADGTLQPAYFWDPVIAPGGMAFYSGDLFPAWQGSLFVTGLNSEYVARLILEGDQVVGEERILAEQQVRWRDVDVGPDGALYLTTDPCGNGGRCTPEQVATGKLVKLVPRR